MILFRLKAQLTIMNLPDSSTRLGLNKFKSILSSCSDLEQKDRKGRTALFRVARIGRDEHLAQLIEAGANVNSLDAVGETPVGVASRYGHLDCVKMLINAGANINFCANPSETDYPDTALSNTIWSGHLPVVEMLLNAGADPNIGYGDHFPIIYAIRRERPDILKLLISASVDVNMVARGGCTPLHVAAGKGDVECVNILLAAGADINALDDEGATPLIRAIFESVVVSHEPADPMPVVYALMKGNPDLTIRERRYQWSALKTAMRFELDELVEFLKMVGAPPENEFSKESGFSITTDLHGNIVDVTADVNSDDSGDDEDWDDEDDSEATDEVNNIDDLEHLIDLDERDLYNLIKLIAEEVFPVTERDEKIADSLNKSHPNIVAALGWKASKSHWKILKALEKKPLPIERIAYFARGWFNTKPGHELSDGDKVLGESYNDAIGRFIEEGLIDYASPEESIYHGMSVKEIQAELLELSCRTSGSKSELVSRLIENAKTEQLDEITSACQHYTRTSKGELALNDEEICLSSGLRQLKENLLQALEEHEFTLSGMFARMHRKIAGDNLKISGQQIAIARFIVETDARFFLQCNSRCRHVVAASMLIGYNREKWNDWGVSDPPRYLETSEEITLRELLGYLRTFIDDHNCGPHSRGHSA